MGREVEEHKETKEARGEVKEHVQEAYQKDALKGLQADKMSDYADKKSNIDKVTVGDHQVDLNDGKHEREKQAIKDAASALAKGDTDALKKVTQGPPPLTPQQAETVAAGLDKALRPGVAVNYDKESKAFEFYTNPPRIGNSSSDKVMVPIDGGTAQKGKGETFYSKGEPQVNSDATGADLKKVVDTAQKAYEDSKQKAGLR